MHFDIKILRICSILKRKNNLQAFITGLIDGWLQGVRGSAKTANTFFVLLNFLGERVIVSKGFIIPELEAADLKLLGSDLEGSLLYVDHVPDLPPPHSY